MFTHINQNVSKSVGAILSLWVFGYDPKNDTNVSFYKHQDWISILIEISNSLIFNQSAEEACVHKKER